MSNHSLNRYHKRSGAARKAREIRKNTYFIYVTAMNGKTRKIKQTIDPDKEVKFYFKEPDPQAEVPKLLNETWTINLRED